MRETRFKERVPKDWVQKKPEATKEMPDSFRELGERLFEYESNEEGLDMERVRDFLHERGLNANTEILFASEDDRNSITRDLAALGIPLGSAEGQVNEAVYVNHLDMIVLFRSEELEERNGTFYTESLALHELAHASSGHDTYLVFDERNNQKKAIAPRFGLTLNHGEGRGHMLEEGFAEMITGEYASENMPEEQRRRLRSILGLPAGTSIDERLNIKTQHGLIPTSLKDFYINENGEVNIMPEKYAGIAMELLIEQDPSLRDALIEARTDVKGLRKVAYKINKIKKGLYMEMRKTPFESKELIKKLQEINEI